MPQEINISDEEIQYAERLLLPVGKTFDDERKVFIRNFNTIDLQAVPGSGKTTALLAKLIILESKLPFAEGSGILVLSHTNAAIDEIKEKIQKYCPRLFSYPNFIGTIQSFVDEFLAVPFYVQKFNKKPIRIDHEIYNEKIKNCIEKPWLYKLGFDKDITDKVAYIKNNNEGLFYNYRFQYSTETQLVKKLNGDVLEVSKPRGRTRTENYRDYTPQEKQSVYNWFLRFKIGILQSGILHYDDAYFLADVYLNKIPSVKTILQTRFSFVFVDEMQDMDTHQYNLLEKVFYDDGNSISKIQRIGDKNQAIYNSFVKANDNWVDRPEVLRLNGSQRLSKHIANVVKKFALYSDETFDIVGKNECEIKPHILVFENETIGNIIACFAQIVKEKGLGNSEKPIKAVCWNTEWKEDETSRNDAAKLRLEDYHKGFAKDKGKPKQDYDNLKSYLLYYEQKQTLEPIRKNILNAFLKILRLENINTTDDRPYTKKKLIDFIHEKDVQKYDELNLNIYNWSIEIVREKTNEVWEEIKTYIPTLLAIFDKTVSISSNFINDDNAEISVENAEILAPTNHYKADGFEIEITSVHAVKGQTHCATLYLESYFQQDGRGTNAKSYESQRLKDQFLGTQIQSTVGDRVKQSAKMAYVGFSRPTDLLCIAIHKDRFNALQNTISTDIWEIITV
ncbi:UvrD/REP helicase N-terminal domain-containing protein [Paenimyroides aquimaris]|uniref:UvrD/REP helicase N-terminal domain-containing protein n=1 Tax=Paenimyroides marinum TaxID=1159016 RepID=A0A1H6JMT5_9FLAO|nr:UvrD-helicase domain-containing protein [Paenimyroides aquimaris]SEH63376.1 UvrD/REP helicase N-terminal domain-containing protein [Paenimyroides aquimaris]